MYHLLQEINGLFYRLKVSVMIQNKFQPILHHLLQIQQYFLEFHKLQSEKKIDKK